MSMLLYNIYCMLILLISTTMSVHSFVRYNDFQLCALYIIIIIIIIIIIKIYIETLYTTISSIII